MDKNWLIGKEREIRFEKASHKKVPCTRMFIMDYNLSLVLPDILRLFRSNFTLSSINLMFKVKLRYSVSSELTDISVYIPHSSITSKF